MRVLYKSYNNAEKIIHKDLLNSTINSLEKFHISPRGRQYFNKMLELFRDNGWSKNVPIKAGSKMKINGIKNDIGFVIYLGNHYTGYHYLLNLEYMFFNNKIIGGIFLTQTKKQAILKNQMRNPDTFSTGNFIEYEKFCKDFEDFTDFLRIPLIIIGIEEEKICNMVGQDQKELNI